MNTEQNQKALLEQLEALKKENEQLKKELSILGSRLNCNCFDEVIDSFENGSLHPEHLMTHTRHFTEIEAALDEICNHPQNVLKTVLHFS